MAFIVVAGSLNMDFVVRVQELPSPGQTVLGAGFRMIPGGKGANQACAAGRIGSGSVGTKMVGRVGCDPFADSLKASLLAADVDVANVAATGEPTGIALIQVDASGQNSIVVAPGANHTLTAADAEGLRPVFRGAAFVLFQLETPLDAVEAAMRAAREEGARTMLDPAPAQPLPECLLQLVDVLTPNETEALVLLGRPPGRVDAAEAGSLAEALLAKGPAAVVVKLGDQGCWFTDGSVRMHSPGLVPTPWPS